MQGDHGYYGGGGSNIPAGNGRDHHKFGGYFFGSSASSYYPNNAAYPTPPAGVPAFDEPFAGFPAGRVAELEFQPSDTCPKNFVIFDQTYSKSRVMFHPSLALPGFADEGGGGQLFREAAGATSAYDYDYAERRSGTYKEDTAEIDALLSSEEAEDDDTVSTARTAGCRGDQGSSPDSCSSSQRKSSGGGGGSGKRGKLKKMVRTLKGIVPGADQMDTPAVLDEAVRYLKSLKVEARKLAARNSDRR